jgi:hypothetical protein
MRRIIRHAKLLYNHMVNMNCMEEAFDKVSPILLKLGQRRTTTFVIILQLDVDERGSNTRLGVSLVLS